MSLRQEYSARLDSLGKVAERLSEFLTQNLSSENAIDSISVRVKDLERFMAKAEKKNENGELRYENPLSDIQDIIGARIVVRYLKDVENLKAELGRLLRSIEVKTLEPESFSEFGYSGWHTILRLPEEAFQDSTDESPPFFELQVKTIFQHAWSEAEHDLQYKELSGDLTPYHRRLIGFAAAQAWGADNAFASILRDMSRKDGK